MVELVIGTILLYLAFQGFLMVKDGRKEANRAKVLRGILIMVGIFLLVSLVVAFAFAMGG